MSEWFDSMEEMYAAEKQRGDEAEEQRDNLDRALQTMQRNEVARMKDVQDAIARADEAEAEVERLKTMLDTDSYRGDFWKQRAESAEAKLADHGPDGHNVTNGQYVSEFQRYSRQIKSLRGKLAAAESHFAASQRALTRAMAENRENAEAREKAEAERDKYRDTLLACHGGEPLALLDELDETRAKLAAVTAQATDLLDAIYQTVMPDEGDTIVTYAFCHSNPAWVETWLREHPTAEEETARQPAHTPERPTDA